MDDLSLKVALALHVLHCKSSNNKKQGMKKEKVRKPRKTSQKKPKQQEQSQTTQTDPFADDDLPAEIVNKSQFEDTQQLLEELQEQAIEQNQVLDVEVPHISSVLQTADITVVDLLQNLEQVQKHLQIDTSMEPREFIASVIEKSHCKLSKHNYHILNEIFNLFKDDKLLCQLMFQRVKTRLVVMKAANLDDSISVANQLYILLKLLLILLGTQNYDNNDAEEFRIWLQDILQFVDLEHAIIVDLLLKVQQRLER